MSKYQYHKYESPRLTYEMIDESDVDLLLDLDSDSDVMKYITGKATTREEMVNVLIPRLLSYTDHRYGWGQWKTFTKDTGEFIGWFLIRLDKDHPNQVEIGWRLKKEFWGKGYGTEGALLFMEHSFNQDNVSHVFAIAHPDNTASHAIMEKIGLKFLKQYTYKVPNLLEEEVVHYELSREDYLRSIS